MATPDLTGKTLGNYQILEEIGRGGMAVVYRAYQTSLNRHAAIKVLPPQLAFDRDFVQRFVREAQAAASLNHPNIVVIYDVGHQDGLYYMAMEYLQGQTLRQLIQREGSLDPRRAAGLLQQIGSALDYAHQRGFVHRDVKPANIFVGPGDRVTLTDFGIAKAASETEHLTRTGMLVGTPEYMSPEQAQGEEVDLRTDVYALGVVLYQMLTGQAPFRATTPHAILHAVIYSPPPPLRQRNPRISPAVESVVLKALAKKPGDRFQSCGDLVRAYQQALSGVGVKPPAPGPRPAKPAPAGRSAFWPLVAGLAAVALLLLLVGGWLLLRLSRPGPATPTAGLAGEATPTAVARQEPTQPATPPPGPDTRATEDALRATESALQATARVLDGRSATGTAQAWEQQRSEATAQAAARQATEEARAAAEAAQMAATQTAAARQAAAEQTDTAATRQAATLTAEALTAAAPPPPPPPCPLPVDGQLAGVWDRDRLGCPTAGAATVWSAWEPFERGAMLWRSDTDRVTVFYYGGGDNLYAGSWWQAPDYTRWDGSNPDGVGLSPPPGLLEPVRGFGYLWREYLGGPDSDVGWARDQEKGFCARIQPFQEGWILRSSTVEYCEDQYFNWATHPSFAPLFFAVYGSGDWQRF